MGFKEEMDDLVEYYNTHECIENGELLKNKKYWYIWFDKIQYGYIDYKDKNAVGDGSCENRFTFYDEAIFKSFNTSRRVELTKVADNKKDIIKLYAKQLIFKNIQLKAQEKISVKYPEFLI